MPGLQHVASLVGSLENVSSNVNWTGHVHTQMQHPYNQLAHLEVQMCHDVLDLFFGVVCVFHAGVGFGQGQQQRRIQSPT